MIGLDTVQMVEIRRDGRDGRSMVEAARANRTTPCPDGTTTVIRREEMHHGIGDPGVEPWNERDRR